MLKFKKGDKVRCTANEDELYSMSLIPTDIGDGTGAIIELLDNTQRKWWNILWSNNMTWYCLEKYLKYSYGEQEQLLLFDLV